MALPNDRHGIGVTVGQAVVACLGALAVLTTGCLPERMPAPGADGIFHVRPGGDIQSALDAAADQELAKTVRVHAGTYRPARRGQAFLHLKRRHDGITLEAEGRVVLTAANPDVANEGDPGYPAIVNHVVYFGDGITRSTTLSGFEITGANGFLTREESPDPIEPEPLAPGLRKGTFFYTDGGGIKIFGRSYPTIVGVEVHGNYSSPCGAGVSLEHQGNVEDAVLLRDCVFRGNRSPVTGAAVDLLHGSSAILENCLFVDNLSNEPLDEQAREIGVWRPESGAGALTVFPGSRIVVRRCTFTGNRNGVDDGGVDGVYEDCLFWRNNAPGGWPTGARYELSVRVGRGVRGCFLQGDVIDLQGTLRDDLNTFPCGDPEFDEDYRPRAPELESVGYRPREPAGSGSGGA